MRSLYLSIIGNVMEVYQPEAVAIHENCLRYLRSFNVPLMVLSGGGYTVHNVARCWWYKTAVAVGAEPKNKRPKCNEYLEYFATWRIKYSPKGLEKLRTFLLQRISKIHHAPSVQFQERPSTTEPPAEEEEGIKI
ncbi:hypothetical protein MKW94_028493 [Papaver nudicaule]|uniref:Histone deacetylase n=1 Tax=Papaver nudicaule TaxID=74823 RepID=A0AA41SFD3_PAPNU|nr:hypothetical protein [Papaver nudicaule]